MTEKKCITINRLFFSYCDSGDVVSDISLEVNKEQKVAVVGPNGSGKTTLFFLMCGLLKPQRGRITVDGKAIKHNSFNKEVSYLFQSPDDQLFSATIWDDIAFGPLNMGMDRNTVASEVDAALKTTEISYLKSKSPHHLSGGEKRLAALATLIAMQPEVYLLDEPTSNLDARNRRNIISLIQRLPATMMISSHDLEFLLEVCDRCILIDNGKIAADGSIREILSDESLLQQHHLEKPHSLIPHEHNV
ncbi:MAG: ATP-binding cassette domain-containing protein [Chitinivibrionales bacterium]|nr:ATP-binding cassette domain-containing protein [Chitinivibrionales bacterium]